MALFRGAQRLAVDHRAGDQRAAPLEAAIALGEAQLAQVAPQFLQRLLGLEGQPRKAKFFRHVVHLIRSRPPGQRTPRSRLRRAAGVAASRARA